jgi:hypothetical protein
MSNPENPVGRAAVPADTIVRWAAVPAINEQAKIDFDGTKLPLVEHPSQSHNKWYDVQFPIQFVG